jgi:hypothetical protein
LPDFEAKELNGNPPKRTTELLSLSEVKGQRPNRLSIKNLERSSSRTGKTKCRLYLTKTPTQV